MKKEVQTTEEQASVAAKIVKQKENVIVFKKKNSGKLGKTNKDLLSDDEIEHNRLNGSIKPKPQLPSEESVSLPESKTKDKKALPVLALANNAGKKLIIHKALLQYAKNLPAANPHQDKQALQHEALQLKQKNNQLVAENIRLRTKLMSIEKQNIRLQKVVDEEKLGPIKQISTAASGGRPLNLPKSTEQTVHSLKALLKDTRKELDELRQQNGKIKRSVKYTRINELQNEKKCYSDEALRLRQLLEEQFNQNIQHKMQRLEQSRKQHDISALEHKISLQSETIQALRRENSEIAGKLKKAEEKLKFMGKATDVERNLNKVVLSLKKAIKQKEIENENLKKEVKECKETSKQPSLHEQKPKVPSAPKNRPQPKSVQSIPVNPSILSHNKCQSCNKLRNEVKKLNDQIKKLQEQLKTRDDAIENLKSKPPGVKSTVKKPSAEILKVVADFLIYRFKAHHLPIEATEAYLFRKDQQGQPTTSTTVGTMIEILLTQPFFITNSEYLESLVVHLFYHQKVEEQFEIDQNLQKPNSQLFETFKSLLGPYSILEASKQQEMFIQIAQLVTSYCQHISAAFDSKRNGEGTISRGELTGFLNQIQLEKEYIEFIITQIILESSDLEHLNYFALFEIFYLPVQEEGAAQGGKKLMGIEGEVKELDEEYEDSQSHNNDVEDHKQHHQHRGKPTKDKSMSRKQQSHQKVQQDYYQDFDENEHDQDHQQPPVQKKQVRSPSKPQAVAQQAKKGPEDQEEYSADYQM